MPCETCGVTIAQVGELTDGRLVWLCPRCGTCRVVGVKHADTYVPTIVARSLDLIAAVDEFAPDRSSYREVRSLREAATGRADR